MKNFKGFVEEMMTTGDAGIPQDTVNMKPRGKKRSAITRRYLEVNGVRKLRVKESNEKKEACWDSHKQVGTKKKGGKTVPNCVPKESSKLDELSNDKVHDYLSKSMHQSDDAKSRGDSKLRAKREKGIKLGLKKQTGTAKVASTESYQQNKKKPGSAAKRGLIDIDKVMDRGGRKADAANKKKPGSAAKRGLIDIGTVMDHREFSGYGESVEQVDEAKNPHPMGSTRVVNKKGHELHGKKVTVNRTATGLAKQGIHGVSLADGSSLIGHRMRSSELQKESVEHLMEDETLTKDQLPRNVAAVVKKVFKVIKKHKKPGRVSVHKYPKGKYTVFIAVGRDNGREEEYEEYTGDLISIIPWEKRKNSKIEIDVAASVYPAPQNTIREGVEEAKQQRANAGKTNKLSSAEYQREKKKASFNRNEWKWNGDLYDRVRKEEVEQVDEAKRVKMKIAGRDVVVVPAKGSSSEFYYQWKRKDGKKGYAEYDTDFDGKTDAELKRFIAKEIKAQDKKDGTSQYGRFEESVEQVDEISQGMKNRYIKRAAMSAASNANSDGTMRGIANKKQQQYHKDQVRKRLRGIGRATKESVEFIEEKTFKANLSDKDYQKIRSASMRGNFAHKFSRKTNGDVTFNTKNPVTLTKDLEKLIDSGETSWSDILDIYAVHKKSKSVWPGQAAGGGAFMAKGKKKK